MGAHHPRTRYLSAIAAWWVRRPDGGLPGKRTWLVLTVVVAAFVVLASVVQWQSGDRTVLERPVAHGGGVARPLPSGQSPPAEPASTASSVPADPASSAGVPQPGPPLPTVQPQPPARPDPPAPAPPPFMAVAGFRCPDTATSGFTMRYVPPHTGWYFVTGGGWAGDGCQGHLMAMPMSGDANRDDPTNAMLWWFKMPPRPGCAVEVYVPRGPSLRDAAGAPATYFVYGTTDGSGSPLGRFDIQQVPNQGRWVAVGKFPATSGRLSVQLMSRGVSNADNAHLGGSAVRVNC